MSHISRALVNEALALPTLERAGLIEELLASFDLHSRGLIDSAWAVEAEKRIDQFESGNTTAITLAESRERINQHRSHLTN